MKRSWRAVAVAGSAFAATLMMGSGTALANAHACDTQGSDRGCATTTGSGSVSITDKERDFHKAYTHYQDIYGNYGKLFDSNGAGGGASVRYISPDKFRVCESVPGGGMGNDYCTGWNDVKN